MARDNRRYVERCRDHYLSALSACVRDHWTADRYTSERNERRPPLEAHTGHNAGEILGYSRACFDAVWPLLEWRLGFEDVASAYPAHGFPFGPERDALGLPLPTHGAHFWRGSNDLFTAWEAL